MESEDNATDKPEEKPIKQNTIEPSKTARASCKECGAVIAKGELRFCLVDFSFSEHGSFKYLHLACAQKRRPKELEEVLAAGRFEVPRAEIDAALVAAEVKTAVAPPWLDLAPTAAGTAVVGKRPGELPPFVADADPPRTKEGTALDAAMVGKLVVAMKDPKSAQTLERFEAWLDEASLRAFSFAIFERWARGSGHMREKWLFKQIARGLDAAGAKKLGILLEGWLKVNRRPAAEAGLEVLESNGSEAALIVLQSLAQRFHYKGGGNLAQVALNRVARARKMETLDLEDSLVPRGKLARAEADATVKAQTLRLEHALSGGRLWDPAAWEANLVKHPLLSPLVRALVWAAFDDDGPPVAFVVDGADPEKGVLRTEDGEAFDLPETKIGLVHPVELSAETRARWLAILAEAKLVPPFPQLTRAIHLLPASDADGDALTSYPKRAIAPGPLHGILNRAAWIKSMPEDMRVHHFHKRFETQGVTGVIRLDPGLSVQMGDDTPQTAIEAFFIREKGLGLDIDKLALTDVPKVAVSEVLHDLAALHGS